MLLCVHSKITTARQRTPTQIYTYLVVFGIDGLAEIDFESLRKLLRELLDIVLLGHYGLSANLFLEFGKSNENDMRRNCMKAI